MLTKIALQHYVKFIPILFIFSQASRLEYIAYKLHTYSAKKTLSCTSKLYFKYDLQLLLWKIQGVWEKIQVVMNGIVLRITKNLLQLTHSLTVLK